jgi:phosphoglycerate-specific signal transduction histidine kinase
MEWLTVTEVSRRLNISDRTLRRYIHDHKLFIDIRKEQGRPMEIHESSIEILKQIRVMYEKGWDSVKIHRYLSRIKPMIIPVEDDKKNELPATVGEALNEIKSLLEGIAQKQVDLENQINDIRQQQRLQLQGIHRIEELSRVEKYKKKKGFFSRLFDK